MNGHEINGPESAEQGTTQTYEITGGTAGETIYIYFVTADPSGDYHRTEVTLDSNGEGTAEFTIPTGDRWSSGFGVSLDPIYDADDFTTAISGD